MDYEAARQLRVAENRAVLARLGIKPAEVPGYLPPPQPVKKKAKQVAKRREKRAAQAAVQETRKEEAEGGPRRSARVSRKPVLYEALPAEGAGAMLRETPRKKAPAGRPFDRNVVGPIPGVPVGAWYEYRADACRAGVHRRTIHGIAADKHCAYSVALSAGFEDDCDFGEGFTYTGSGGRDLKGTKANPKNLRTAPQTKDQVWEGDNAALKLSFEKKLPVRVIRGYFKKSPGGAHERSPYAPLYGYRYDGLYKIDKVWQEVGASGFKVCKFAFTRLPGQAPLPLHVTGVEVPVEAEDGDEEMEEGGSDSGFSGSEV
ncbi:PUA-like domain-containing protein [Hyaloraphidium curvatum]|nr:PUA-like domain-containing protein [Hyaloraphidium curvatum]